MKAAQKIINLPQFQRSRSHLLYAIALDRAGQPDAAEKEFRKMVARFSFYEYRYKYGLFRSRWNRVEEAKQLYEGMLEEESHLSSREKRNASPFFKLVREQLKSL